MSTRIWWGIVIVLLIVIAVLAWMLFATPVSTGSPQAATSTTSAMTTQTQPSTPAPTPITTATVSMPAANATVGQTFSVAGIAPNTWYFEAVFPIKVVDPDDDTIGSGQAQAQTDWTTPGPVPFTASISVVMSYTGPATLVLLKDNESGLPQNDDSVSVPIVIQ